MNFMNKGDIYIAGKKLNFLQKNLFYVGNGYLDFLHILGLGFGWVFVCLFFLLVGDMGIVWSVVFSFGLILLINVQFSNNVYMISEEGKFFLLVSKVEFEVTAFKQNSRILDTSIGDPIFDKWRREKSTMDKTYLLFLERMDFDDLLSIYESKDLESKVITIRDYGLLKRLSELQKRVLYIILLDLDIRDSSVSKTMENLETSKIDMVLDDHIKGEKPQIEMINF